MNRKENLERLREENAFDVTIIGAGINGACLYDLLCRQGYRVLLVDKGDLASGTSQASGMMIWGGLLYLKNLDLVSVTKLSMDRNSMVRNLKEWMSPRKMRYLPLSGSGRPEWFMHLGLWIYWLMGLGATRVPASEPEYPEKSLLKPEAASASLAYEEAFLETSDARFVLRWIAPHHATGQIALNHCVVDGDYDAAADHWSLQVHDLLQQERRSVTTALIVNCAGVWTDEVNAQFKVETPFRHALSKGVYLGIRRDASLQSSLVFELGEHGDVLTLVPWGPLALWGPTETAVKDLSSGLTPHAQDIDHLLDHYNRRMRHPITRNDIVSIRCGIRPLCVNKDYDADVYPLDLSRKQEVVLNLERPWISCYGGKITGCTRMAANALEQVRRVVRPSGSPGSPQEDWEKGVEWTDFPGLGQKLPSAAWCARHELCATLDDYLRRRTNIAQWMPRMGLGEKDEHTGLLRRMALEIAEGDEAKGREQFEEYHQKVMMLFDPLVRTS